MGYPEVGPGVVTGKCPGKMVFWTASGFGQCSKFGGSKWGTSALTGFSPLILAAGHQIPYVGLLLDGAPAAQRSL